MKLSEPRISRRNARGKKTRAPGYEPNNHWNICDLCGCAIRAKDSRKTWDGLIVCPDDWDYRHPQDFVRSRTDDTRPVGLSRPEEVGEAIPLGVGVPLKFIPEECSAIAVAGLAIAGCAVAGTDYPDEDEDLNPDLPSGSFGDYSP